MPKTKGQDYLSEAGAAALAGRIEAYWMKRAGHVNVWTERVSVEDRRRAGGESRVWSVKSNLIGGLPDPKVAVRLTLWD